jgi:hypothetical protein
MTGCNMHDDRREGRGHDRPGAWPQAGLIITLISAYSTDAPTPHLGRTWGVPKT